MYIMTMKAKNIYRLITVLLFAILLLFVFACGIELSDTGSVPNETLIPEQVIASPLPVNNLAPVPAPSPEVHDPPEEDPAPDENLTSIEVWPVWMYIPALGVDAQVQDTGNDYEAKSMAIVPSASILSWWRESAIPGNEGNAIFGGHNRWKGEVGQLLKLDDLEVGDLMEIVYADDTILRFMLESVFVYPLATAPAHIIMDVGGEARVTVITCKDPFNPAIGTSDNRIVAIFKPEDGFIIPDPPVTPFPLRDAQ